MDGLWSCCSWNPCNKQQTFYSHLYSTGVMVGCWKAKSRATKLDQKKTWRQTKLCAFQSSDNNMPNINQGMAKVSQCFIMYNSTCVSLFSSYIKEISGVCTLTQHQFKLLVKAAQVKSLNNESNVKGVAFSNKPTERELPNPAAPLALHGAFYCLSAHCFG